jgi:hypothetical protein
LAEFVEFIVKRIKNNERSKFGLFPEEWYQFVSREKFFEVREKDDAFSQFCRIAYSFGNRGFTYLYGKPIERQKYLAHQFVVFQCKKSLQEFNEMLNVNFTMSNANTWNDRRMHYKNEWNAHLKADPLFQEMLATGFLKEITDLTTASKKKWIAMKNDRGIENLENIQNLGRIQNLERIENLEQIQNLE